MTLQEILIWLVAISTTGKVLRELLKHRRENKREQRKLEHELKLAQIQAGYSPETGLGPRELQEMKKALVQLQAEKAQLQERVEHLETIVTSSSLELNERFSRILGEEKPPLRSLPPRS